MKKGVFAALAAVLFLFILPVNAQITVNSTVDDSVFVSYSFENLDADVYSAIMANLDFNSSTIPKMIMQNLQEQNFKLVRWGLGPQPDIVSDDATRSIKTEFYLGGSDIISFTFNRTTMSRIYKVRTDWRKIKVNLTTNLTVDFASRLAKPLAEWQKTSPTTFFYQNSEPNTIDILFYLNIPQSASRIQVQADTVTYEMPPLLSDQLINSPFLVLGAIAVALVIALVYRRAR